MSKNIEFIAAKDLPISEAEEVSVLCLENGELKQKQGASLGGGGYILRPAIDEISVEGSDGMTISTNCDDMVKAIEKGSSAYILLPSDILGVEMLLLLGAFAYMDDVFIGVTYLMGGNTNFVFTNITHVPNFAG